MQQNPLDILYYKFLQGMKFRIEGALGSLNFPVRITI